MKKKRWGNLKIAMVIIGVIFLCWAVKDGCKEARGDLGIKKASEFIVMPLNEPLDSAGLPLKPDSVHIITYADNGSAKSFSATNTTYPFTAAGIDTTKDYGDTNYFFVDQIQDIDGTVGNFSLAIKVTFFCDGLPTTTHGIVQVVDDSLNKKFGDIRDTTNVILDTLQLQDGWVATSANQTLIIDTVNAVIDTQQNQDGWIATSANQTLIIDTVNAVIDTQQNQDGWIAQETSVDVLEDTVIAILDTIQAHAPHGNDWGQGAGEVTAVADTVNAILDTIQAHAPHGNDWGQGGGELAAITDTVNAIIDTLQNQDGWVATSSNQTVIIDTVNGIMDTLQAGFGSRTAIGDTIQRAASTLTEDNNIGIDLDDVTGTLDAAEVGVGAIHSTALATGAIPNTVFATDAISASKIKSDVAEEIGAGVWANIDTAATIDTSLLGEWFTTGISASLSDANMGAIADTLGNRGYYRGAGARTVIVSLKDVSDSTTAVSGFDITVRDSAGSGLKARISTNTSGLCTLSLDDGTYAVHMTKNPGWSITTPQYRTVSKDSTYTFYATSFDPGTPASGAMCTIYGWEADFQDSVQGGCRLSVRISSTYPVESTTGRIIGTAEKSMTSDSDSGYVYMDVYRSDSLIMEDGTHGVNYHIELFDPNGRTMGSVLNYTVPDSGNHKIVWR